MYTNILLIFQILINVFFLINNNTKEIKNINFIKCNNIDNWNNHKRMISKIKNFKADGIIIYKNGVKRMFLNFYWDNIYSKYFKFKACTFFGIKLIEFIYNYDNIYIKNFGEKSITEKNPDSLFKKIYKTNIPIKNFRYWIIGLPGNSKNFLINNKGYLKEIQYIDKDISYKIVYNKYNKKFNPPLPEFIELYQGKNKLSLNIKNWNIS